MQPVGLELLSKTVIVSNWSEYMKVIYFVPLIVALLSTPCFADKNDEENMLIGPARACVAEIKIGVLKAEMTGRAWKHCEAGEPRAFVQARPYFFGPIHLICDGQELDGVYCVEKPDCTGVFWFERFRDVQDSCQSVPFFH